MIKLSIIEMILRAIPEGILDMTSIYVLSGTKINIRTMFLSGGLLGILLYFIRMLPVQFGIHTIIFLVALILIAIWVNKIDVNKAISSSLISMIILSICDWISIFIITNIFKDNVKNIMSNSLLKLLYGLPSLLLYLCIISVIYKMICKKRKSGQAFL